MLGHFATALPMRWPAKYQAAEIPGVAVMPHQSLSMAKLKRLCPQSCHHLKRNLMIYVTRLGWRNERGEILDISGDHFIPTRRSRC